MASSPKYKNLGLKPKQSPIEIKEKMRKNYKNRVQNCRGILLDKLRSSITEIDLHNTLTNIYKSMFEFSAEKFDGDEIELMDEIKHELVQEEMEWWNKEYEQSQMVNVDWSAIEENNDVICPICQKTNFKLNKGILSCAFCKITIPTEKSLPEIKNCILSELETHNSVCNSNVQFNIVTEINKTHVCLTCAQCMEMKLII